MTCRKLRRPSWQTFWKLPQGGAPQTVAHCLLRCTVATDKVILHVLGISYAHDTPLGVAFDPLKILSDRSPSWEPWTKMKKILDLNGLRGVVKTSRFCGRRKYRCFCTAKTLKRPLRPVKLKATPMLHSDAHRFSHPLTLQTSKAWVPPFTSLVSPC